MSSGPISHGAAVICILAAVFLFSLVDVLAKWLASEYPVNQIVFFRMFFGLVPAFVLLGAGGFRSDSLWTARPLMHLWRATTGLGAMGLFFFALPLMPLADAVAVSFTKPLILACLAVPLLGEHLGFHRFVAAILGFLGVLIIVGPTGTYTNWLGPAFALGSALCFALSMISVRRLSETESTPVIVLYYTATAALVSGVSLVLAWKTPDWRALGLFIALGLTGGAGQLLMTAAFRRAPATVLGPFNYTAILWAVLFGYLVWDEAPGFTTVIGSLLVIGAGICVLQEERIKQA